MDFDLSLTGFNSNEIEELIEGIDNEEKFEESIVDRIGDDNEKYQILITLDSELQQEELYYKLHNEGYECKTLIS